MTEVFRLSVLEGIRDLLRAGRFVQAAREAEEALDGDVSPTDQAQLNQLLGVARYKVGALWPAIQATRTAEGLAAEWGLPEVLGRARINLVAMLLDIGDYALAAETGARLLRGAADLPDQVRVQLCWVHYNLARVYHAQRQHRLMYEQVRLAIESADSDHFLVMVHQQAAWWRYLDDHIDQGDRHREVAGELLTPDDTEGAREMLILECLRAHQTGDMERAVTLSEEFLLSEMEPPLLQRVWAAYIAGSAALHLDHISEAGVLAGRSLDWAIELGDPGLMNRANELRRRVEQRKQAAGD